MRRFKLDADAGAHRRIFGVDPLVPGAVHLAFLLHVGDVDDRREDFAFVGAAQCEALVDATERLDGLLVQGGSDRIGRDRHGKHEAVVHDGAAAGGREAGKTVDHGLLHWGYARSRCLAMTGKYAPPEPASIASCKTW